MRCVSFKSVVLGGVSTLAFVSAAAAQTTDQAAPANEVVVTGSRLIANGNNMPTPVTVVSAENLDTLKPTTVIDAINELPVFSGGRTQSYTGTPTGGTGGGSAASSQLSLRDLGPLRTLVLFDGQRVAPTSSTNVVDADIIPQMLIQRVDVVTGGVSAVYGSDAVAGVVNFIPDKTFKGLKFEAQVGESRYGDDKNYKIGIAGGVSLGGKGHIEGSLETYDNGGVMSQFSRPWYNSPGLTGAGTAANPLVLQSNIRSNLNTFGGLINSGVLSGQQFATNGVLSPFVHGTATGTASSEIGGNGSYTDGSLASAIRWTQAYGRGDYDFSDHIHGHVQASFKHMYNEQLVTNNIDNNYTLSSTNAFLPAAYQAQLAAAKQTTFKFSETVNQTPPWGADVYTDQLILNGGLDGDLLGYKWNVGANYGQANLTDYLTNDQNNQHLAAALDAVVNPANGQIVCNVTLTNPASDPGCAPLNLFGPTAASQAALAYAYPTTKWDGVTKMYDVNFAVSGQPFSTWAGPVGVALSGEWRRTTFSSSTADPSTQLADCTGLRFNCANTTLEWANAFGVRSEVGISVAEGAAEFDAPLLKDMPFARSLSFNGAVRYMSYSSSGDYTAWKLGLVWEVNDELHFRGTASRDIRAPTINDLYAPVTTTPTTAQDLLTGLTPTVTQFRGGNPEIKPEIGYTDTIGAVYKPHWLPGASLSVDAFDITIDNAIAEIRGISNSAQLACYASGGSSTYCELQTRPLGFTNTTAANTVTAWGQENINISSLTTYGADVEADYVGRVLEHRVMLRSYVTWQPHILNTTPGLTNVDLSGTAQAANPNIASPSLRITATESVNLTDQFRVDLTERGRGAERINGDSGLTATCCNLDPLTYLDLNLSYSLTGQRIGNYGLGQSEIFFNINNMLNQAPPTRPIPNYDDLIGQTFVIGFRLRL